MKLPFRVPYWPFLILPALVFGLGFFLNAFVISQNGGYMPVQGAVECALGNATDSGDVIHVCMNPQSHFKFLADWIYFPGLGTASPGDFLEMGGQYSMYPCWFIWLGFIICDYSDDWE